MDSLVSAFVHVVDVVKQLLQVLTAPTRVIFSLLFQRNTNRISQVAYNLAVSRAAESEKEDALFFDPLSRAFAQSVSIYKQPRKSIDERSVSGSIDVPRRTVSYTITRTKFFDDAILTTLGDVENGSGNAMFSDVREIVGGAECSCQQVVALGAGFDTRPWRLPLGTTRWFEVDFKELVEEKKRLLKLADAALVPQSEMYAFPLKTLSLALVPTNIRKASVVRHIQAAGLKMSVPTVWVMEGLLVYLDSRSVERLLTQLNYVSPNGSFLVASMVSEASMKAMNGVIQKNSRRWGCPDDPEEYFGKFGWNVVTILPWTIAAKMYGCKPRKRSVSREDAMFLVAVKA